MRRRDRLHERRVQPGDGLVTSGQAAQHRREPRERAVADRRLRALAQEGLQHPGRGGLLAGVGKPLGLEELLLDGERRHGEACAARQVLHALPGRLTPHRGGRLDPAAPEVGERLCGLALRGARLREADQDPARLGMRRGAREEAPGLALGVRPLAQPEGGVEERELRRGNEERVRKALEERPQAHDRRRVVALAQDRLGGEVRRVILEEEAGAELVERGARPRVLPARQRGVRLAIALERARRHDHGRPGRSRERDEEAGEDDHDERGPAARHGRQCIRRTPRGVPITAGCRGSPARCGRSGGPPSRSPRGRPPRSPGPGGPGARRG